MSVAAELPVSALSSPATGPTAMMDSADVEMEVNTEVTGVTGITEVATEVLSTETNTNSKVDDILEDEINEIIMRPDVIPRKLWEHPDPESTPMWRFLQNVNKRHGLDMKVSIPCPPFDPLHPGMLTIFLSRPSRSSMNIPSETARNSGRTSGRKPTISTKAPTAE